jgi:hypothetical protein
MRTDPRIACANEKERLFWAVVHDLVAHPLMVLTGYSKISLRFHDWTSSHAWPRDKRTYLPVRELVRSERFGMLVVSSSQPGIFQVRHGLIRHTYGMCAENVSDAVEQAEAWFLSLAEDIPESMACRHTLVGLDKRCVDCGQPRSWDAPE